MNIASNAGQRFVIFLNFIGLIVHISSLNIKRSNVGCLKPPIDTVERNRKGGGEYGIRQLSASESKATLERSSILVHTFLFKFKYTYTCSNV
jgi:hypothetical protein